MYDGEWSLATLAQGLDTKMKQTGLVPQLNSIRTSVRVMQKGAYIRLMM